MLILILVSCLLALTGAIPGNNSELELWTAAAEGNFTYVDELLNQGISPLWENPDGFASGDYDPDFTAIHVASKFNHPAVIARLLDAGVDVNLKVSRFSNSPLTAASLYNSIDAANLLLDRGADIDLHGRDEKTPLFVACSKNKTEVAIMLIHRGANVSLAERFNQTPLHEASLVGNKDIVNKLIHYGADVNQEDDLGSTPLDFASGRGHTDIVTILVNYVTDVNRRDDSGETALHTASKGGQADIVNKLISLGADVNVRDNNGNTPLHVATIGYIAIIISILPGGGPADPNLLREDELKRRDAVIALIDGGADVNSINNMPLTPLMIASGVGYLSIAEALINGNADVNLSVNGSTALHGAAWNNETAITKLLLRNGAESNKQDNDGKTPIDIARERGYLQLATIIEDFTANNVKTTSTNTFYKTKSASRPIRLLQPLYHMDDHTHYMSNNFF